MEEEAAEASSDSNRILAATQTAQKKPFNWHPEIGAYWYFLPTHSFWSYFEMQSLFKQMSLENSYVGHQH